MKQFDTNDLYYFFKILGNLFLCWAVKAMLMSLKPVNETYRKLFLYATAAIIILNLWGIGRNVHTLLHYQDFLNALWLAGDFVQTGCAVYVFVMTFLKKRIGKLACAVLIALCIILGGLNFYYFLMNFHWLKIEGVVVFMMWFANNLGNVVWYALIVFLISYHYINTGKPQNPTVLS